MAEGTENGADRGGDARAALPGAAAPSPLDTVVQLLAFCCELAMLAVLGTAGWGLGNGGLMGIAFMVFYPALAILIWTLWMAPRSRTRLTDPWRLVVQLVLFAATAALAGAARHPMLGIAFAVVAAVVFVASRMTGEDAV